MDRRITPYSGRIAHVSLQGEIDAPMTEGEPGQIIQPIADLWDVPGGARDRQLLMGASVTVIDRTKGHVFVRADRDGYCGWVNEKAVGTGPEPTHWVIAPASYTFAEPQVQAREKIHLSLGARVCVKGSWGDWANTPHGFMHMGHLHLIGQVAPDPVGVAESLLGTPYLWGGNSRQGLDCSGLVQTALHAAGFDCPGDSDLQMAVGRGLVPEERLQRGDLIFWSGHVAMVVNNDVLIHANAHSMAVSYEGIVEAINRIAKSGGGLVQARNRLDALPYSTMPNRR
ncbi:MAG: C40 family peptidase [Tabrizicola sp.]|nr:C40 family peptidase [Tabrizicola sp.]